MEDGPFKVRFEGVMYVIRDETPPIEPPPAEPAERTTRLAQYGIGASAHRDIPETDPFDLRIRPATYGWSPHAPYVSGPGWVVRATAASWGMLAQGMDITVARCIRKGWGWTFNAGAFNRCTWNDHVFCVPAGCTGGIR